MKIEAAVVKSFTTRDGTQYGFAVLENGTEVYLGKKNYCRPQILPKGKLAIRIPTQLTCSPDTGDKVYLVSRTENKRTFAIAWCTEADIEMIATTRKQVASQIFGVNLVDKFPELVDVYSQLFPENIAPPKIIHRARAMDPVILSGPPGSAKGTVEHWLAIVQEAEAASYRIAILQGSSRMIDRLMGAGFDVDRETKMPRHAREFVLIRLVKWGNGDIDCFVYYRSAEQSTDS